MRRAQRREANPYSRSWQENYSSRHDSSIVPSGHAAGLELNDADARQLDQETRARQATRTRTDNVQDSSQQDGRGSQSSPGVPKRKSIPHSVERSASKKIPKTEREIELEDTLRAVLEAVDRKSISLRADDGSVQLEGCRIEKADRAVNRLIMFYDHRHEEGIRQLGTRIAAEKDRWEQENQKEKNGLQTQLGQLTTDINSSKDTIHWLNQDISNREVAEQQMASDIQRLRDQNQSYEKTIRSLQTQHETALRNLESQHTVAITALRQHHQETLVMVKSEKDAIISSQKNNLDEAQEHLEQELKNRP
jgi:hypothetical protein